MAQQNGDTPSRSGTVVFVATTTVNGPDNGPSQSGGGTPTSSVNTEDIFWAQTPTPSTRQDSGHNSFHVSSANNQPTPSRSGAPISTGTREQEDSDQRQDSRHHQQSDDGNHDTILIASISATVGTLLIALIALVFLIFLKRRKSATYSKIIRSLPGSNRTTALPVYHPDRDAARISKSSHIGGMQEARPASSQPRKSMNSTKASAMQPNQASVDSADKSSTDPPIEIPSRTLRPNARSLPPMRQISKAEQDPIGLSNDRSVNTPQPEEGLSSPLDCDDARWSWTNSQAPSTPRIAPPNTRQSLTGLSVRSVTSWFRGQDGEDRPQSQQSHRRQRSNPLLLKNQARRPVLAPRPSPRASVKRPGTSLSSRARRVSGSLASGRRSNASHQREDERPLTPLARSISCSSA